MKSMLHGVSGREIIGREMKKHALKSHASKRSGNRRSSQTYVRAIVSLSRNVVKRSKSKRSKLVCEMRMGKRFR
jgi:hypothetical protein